MLYSGAGVAVGGTGVAVGGSGVAVGGTGVEVGGIGVGVAGGVEHPVAIDAMAAAIINVLATSNGMDFNRRIKANSCSNGWSSTVR